MQDDIKKPSKRVHQWSNSSHSRDPSGQLVGHCHIVIADKGMIQEVVQYDITLPTLKKP